MKVQWSPLISQASGAAGPIVASRWRGIDYVRERIIPANPKSDDQKAIRGELTRCIAWWHDLEEQVQDNLDLLCLGLAYSGVNAFTKRNLDDLHSWLVTIKQPVPPEVPPRIMPLNAITNPISTLVAAAGAATKEIDLTWSQAEAAPADTLYILAGEVAGDEEFPANLFLQEKEASAASLEALTLTMPKATQWYFIAVLVEHEADSSFSIACVDWAQSLT